MMASHHARATVVVLLLAGAVTHGWVAAAAASAAGPQMDVDQSTKAATNGAGVNYTLAEQRAHVTGIADSAVESLINGNIDAAIDNVAGRDAEGLSDTGANQRVDIEATEQHIVGNVVSVIFRDSSTNTGAHGDTNYTALLFDLDTGNSIDQSTLFAQNLLPKLATTIATVGRLASFPPEFRGNSDPNARLGDPCGCQATGGPGIGVLDALQSPDPPAYGVDGAGLLIAFDDYQIGGTYSGRIIAVSFGDLGGLLRPNIETPLRNTGAPGLDDCETASVSVAPEAMVTFASLTAGGSGSLGVSNTADGRYDLAVSGTLKVGLEGVFGDKLDVDGEAGGADVSVSGGLEAGFGTDFSGTDSGAMKDIGHVLHTGRGAVPSSTDVSVKSIDIDAGVWLSSDVGVASGDGSVGLEGVIGDRVNFDDSEHAISDTVFFTASGNLSGDLGVATSETEGDLTLSFTQDVYGKPMSTALEGDIGVRAGGSLAHDFDFGKGLLESLTLSPAVATTTGEKLSFSVDLDLTDPDHLRTVDEVLSGYTQTEAAQNAAENQLAHMFATESKIIVSLFGVKQTNGTLSAKGGDGVAFGFDFDVAGEIDTLQDSAYQLPNGPATEWTACLQTDRAPANAPLSGQWLGPQLTVTPTSFGAVRLGMTQEQAASAAGVTFDGTGDGVTYPTKLPAGYPHDYVGVAGATNIVDCFGADIAVGSRSTQTVTTQDGLHLGDSVQRLLAIYGSRARYVPAPAGGMTTHAGYVVAESGGGLAFIVAGGNVVGIVAGSSGIDPNSCTG